MRYFPKLTGKRLYLSPMNPDDAEIYTKWINDPEVCVWLGMHSRVISLPTEKKLLEELAGEDHCNFAIVLREGDQLIGSIGLKTQSPIYRTGELGLFIGEAEHRSKGYGAEAIRLLLDYGFRTLGLHNILLAVNAENTRAIRCYEKCGFRHCARRREAIFFNGHFADRLEMDMLESEFLPEE